MFNFQVGDEVIINYSGNHPVNGTKAVIKQILSGQSLQGIAVVEFTTKAGSKFNNHYIYFRDIVLYPAISTIPEPNDIIII